MSDCSIEAMQPKEPPVAFTYDTEIEGVQVLCSEEADFKELVEYVRRYKTRKPGLYKLYLRFDGEEVDVWYRFKESARPFERIRRITGYLVGTLDRWNDGKRAEESDRVKHGV